MSINIYCSEDLQEHERVACGKYYQSGFTAALITTPNHVINDFSDPAQIQAAIDNETAYLFLDIQADLPLPTEKTVANTVTNTNNISGYTRTINWDDWNTTENNIELYDKLNEGFKSPEVLFFEPLANGIGRCTLVSEPIQGVTFSINRAVDRSNSVFQTFQGTLTWDSFAQAKIIDAPDGIFA